MTAQDRRIIAAAHEVAREYTEEGGALKSLTTNGLQKLVRATKGAAPRPVNQAASCS